MWLKLVITACFVVLVFIWCRLVDMAINGCQLDSLLPNHILLSPVEFSVRQLKRLLDSRGVHYAGFVEKKELIHLVEESGQVSQEELEQIDAQQQENSGKNSDNSIAKEVTQFTCGTHFYEEVEDTKDSAWLVSVMPVNGKALGKDTWTKIVKKLSRFGIRTGVFECFRDPLLCEKKGWHTPRIILALPREGLETKADVVMTGYLLGTNSKEQHIIDWVHRQLASRIVEIDSVQELNNNWLTSDRDKNANAVKVIFLSSLAAPPLILSALAIKFSGRIKFGMLKVDPKNKSSLIAKIDKKISSFLVVLPEKHYYYYGQKPGETITYRSLELFLKSIKPEMNDLFLVSLFFVNLSIALQFFWMKCSKLWKHLIFWFMHMVKFNCILFLFWLMVLALNQFAFMDHLTNFGLIVCRFFAISHLATIIRHDYQYHYNFPVILSTFLFLGIVLYFARRYLLSSPDNDDDHFLLIDWTPWESTLLSYILFRPIGMSGFRSMTSTSIDFNLEEGMELLIERLAVPNLWLQPELISTEYIKNLPVWKFQNQSDTESSENDDINVQHSEDKKDCQIGNVASGYAQSTNQVSSPDSTSHTLTDESNLTIDGCSSSSESLSKHRIIDLLSINSSLNKNDYLEETKETKEQQKRNSKEEQSPSGMLNCNDCAICLETYRKGQYICGLPCGHNYHQKCIMQWICRDNHCCPSCRWPTFKQKSKVC